MHDQYREAKQKGGSTLAAFCTKHLNMWVDAPEVWISDDDIALNNAPFDKERLSGRKCYVGIDFSSKVDISAVALYFPEFQVVDFLFYIPEAKIEETEDRVDYRLWREQGWLTVMPGKVIDEDWFVAHLVGTLDKYDIQRICYDPWGMVAVVPKLGRYEGKMRSFPQNIMNMTRETKDLEAMLLNHELNFLHNPVIRWMFRNVVVHVDPNANIKLDKGKSRNKIDGVVAIVDAIGAYKDYANADGRSIYEDHDLRVINL
jgi:phage terminase large subunit-like protein